MKTVLMEEMSFQQIKTAMNDGHKTVIIVAGATEQHGYHLPLGTDSMLGLVLAKKLAEKLENALVAPVITLGLSKAHMDFAGSLTCRWTTLMAVIEDYVSAYYWHGFKNIVFLPSHMGNFQAIENFVNEARQNYPSLKFACCLNFEMMAKLDKKSLEEDGVHPNIAGAHAGESETSQMLAYYPHLVDMSLAEEGFIGSYMEMRDKMRDEGIQMLAENGILGDARPANAKRGENIVRRMVEAMTEVVREELAKYS